MLQEEIVGFQFVLLQLFIYCYTSMAMEHSWKLFFLAAALLSLGEVNGQGTFQQS